MLLPVTVRDKRGNLVTNLTAADFTLTEDNRPEVIKSFTIQSDLPFLCGLLVDTSRSVSSALDNERAAAGKFVDLMLPATPKTSKDGNQSFLIHFDREVELLEDFTNSREKLHRELTEMKPTAAERNRIGPPSGCSSFLMPDQLSGARNAKKSQYRIRHLPLVLDGESWLSVPSGRFGSHRESLREQDNWRGE